MKTSSNVSKALRFALTAAALTLPLAAAGTAAARSTPAQIGHAYAADVTCFSEAWGSAKNNCSTPRYWISPLIIDSAGYVSPTVTVYAPSPSSTVGCYAYGVSNTSTGTFTFWQSNTAWPTQFGAASTLGLSGAYVPGGGYAMLVCQAYPGGQVNGFVY